jgi:type II secretory pathway component PulK
MRVGRQVGRRGFVLVTVLVIMAISLALFAFWARAAVVEHRRLETRQFRVQAERLAEAGLRRAMVQRENQPNYKVETWRISADELDQVHPGEVRIQVRSAGDDRVEIEATAQYPAGAEHRAQSTKRIEILNPTKGTES